MHRTLRGKVCLLRICHTVRFNSGEWRSGRLTIPLHEIAHKLPFQLVDDVIGNLTTVVVALVDDRAFLFLLRVVVTRKVRVTGPGGIG